MTVLTSTVVRTSALAEYMDEYTGVEPFDFLVPTEREVYEAGLPECAFGSDYVGDPHVYEDTVRQWMECVGCGRLEVRDDWR